MDSHFGSSAQKRLLSDCKAVSDCICDWIETRIASSVFEIVD